MGIEFSLEVDTQQEVPVVRVKGEIDIYTCPQLNKTLNTLIEENKHKFLVLNLEDIHYIDSTGLGSIAHSARILNQNAGKIGVITTKPQIRKIFEISGLNKKNIELFENEKEALEKITKAS